MHRCLGLLVAYVYNDIGILLSKEAHVGELDTSNHCGNKVVSKRLSEPRFARNALMALCAPVTNRLPHSDAAILATFCSQRPGYAFKAIGARYESNQLPGDLYSIQVRNRCLDVSS